MVGFHTRLLALLLAFYTFGTAIAGPHYWNMTGAVQYGNMIHVYKNISIIGGLMLLCVTGRESILSTGVEPHVVLVRSVMDA